MIITSEYIRSHREAGLNIVSAQNFNDQTLLVCGTRETLVNLIKEWADRIAAGDAVPNFEVYNSPAGYVFVEKLDDEE